jgi:hypothetical protein
LVVEARQQQVGHGRKPPVYETGSGEEGPMKIRHCRKYEKYVSQQHCEFFNEGKDCEFYSASRWNSIKDLMQDVNRPKWEVNEVIKPYKCNLLDRESLHQMARQRRTKRKLLSYSAR